LSAIGYDFYTPEHSVCFHHYAESDEGRAKRDNVPTFWENSERYKGSGVAGMRRLLAIVHMARPDPADPGAVSSYNHAEEDRYGLGGVRTPEKLLRMLGINVEKLEMEAHLCKFVAKGLMHQLLTPHLRPDGMGIDYSNIDYEWKDPDKEKVDAAEAEKEESAGDDTTKEGDDSQTNDKGTDDESKADAEAESEGDVEAEA
jgi:Glycosyltransferase (GlcNAc)